MEANTIRMVAVALGSFAVGGVLVAVCQRLLFGSPVVTPAAPLDEEEVINAMARRLVVDESRRDAVRGIVRHLRRCRDGSTSHTRGCSLMLARKGAGKTTLLRTLCDELQARNVVCVTIDCAQVSGSVRLPSVQLSEKVGVSTTVHLPKSAPEAQESVELFRRVHDVLVARKTGALVVVDEVQDIVREPCTNSGRVLHELGMLGNGQCPSVSCVVIGSITWARRLVFGKAGQNVPKVFTNYKGSDLNGTKYTPTRLHPFLEPTLFERVVRHVAGAGTLLQPSELLRLYLVSGGIPGRVAAALDRRGGDSYAAGDCKLEGERRFVMGRLYSLVSAQVMTSATVEPETPLGAGDAEAKGDAADAGLEEGADQSVEGLLGTLAGCVQRCHQPPDFPTRVVYDLEDEGYIVRKVDCAGKSLLGFASPLLYMTCSSTMSLSPSELVAMKFPNEHGTKAEEVTLKCLNHSGAAWCGGQHSEAQLWHWELGKASPTRGGSVPAPRPAGPDSFPQDKFGIAMKEVQGGRDVLGQTLLSFWPTTAAKKCGD